VGPQPAFFLVVSAPTPVPGVESVALTSEEIRALAEPLAADLGLEILDVELLGGRGRRVLRITLERPEPGARVSIADCEAVSRRIGDVLDAYDAIEGHYLLEVTSPGVDRPLKTPRHFARAVGERVKVRLDRPIAGMDTVVGRLVGFEAEVLEIVDDGDTTWRVPLDTVVRANVEFEFPGRPRGRRGRRKKG